MDFIFYAASKNKIMEFYFLDRRTFYNSHAIEFNVIDWQ